RRRRVVLLLLARRVRRVSRRGVGSAAAVPIAVSISVPVPIPVPRVRRSGERQDSKNERTHARDPHRHPPLSPRLTLGRGQTLSTGPRSRKGGPVAALSEWSRCAGARR